MSNSGIIIKGNKEGLNAEISIEQFAGFDEMLAMLLDKLSKGKKFYRGSTLYITINLTALTEKDIEKLKTALLDEIEVKDIVFQDITQQQKEKEEKVFNGIYEGRTKFIKKTIRGGQSINSLGNIVIIGDVNSGAEVYAAGNIIVLGSIKGNVFAGVGGNSNAIIAAFSLQPEILKIGDIITISPDAEKPKYPEVARVKDNAIIVEPYLTNKYIY